ncbi:MAG: DNA-binding protein [Oscillospiraceae bacterium]|nr:DNA-binding protein [Oscillospiraceae bacterium]
MDWITPKQAAEKWSITERRVEALCANSQVEGAIRLSRVWLIPKNATKPIDGRTRAAKQRKGQKGD